MDAASSKVDVVTTNGASSNKPSLFRCNLDGTSCTHTDLSTGQGTGSGAYPSAAIDAVNGQLLLATTNLANSSKPSLYICTLDGSSCSHHDISTSAGANTGNNPTLAYDPIHGRIDVIAQNSTTSGALVFHCSIDGLACERSDPFQGGVAFFPTMAFDFAGQKLVAGGQGSLGLNAARCDSKGLNCSNGTSDLLQKSRIAMSSTGRYWYSSTGFVNAHPILTFIQ